MRSANLTSQNLRRGFTLIEMMVCLAILGVLISLSLPRYTMFQQQARRSELPWMVDSIKTAQHAYHAYEDAYLDASSFHPRTAPSRQRAAWSSGSDFDRLDWQPDGHVWGIYKVTSDGLTFTVVGESDIDGDGVHARYVTTETVTTYAETDVNIF